MLYKTICLELLQQHPQIHDLLRRNRILLPAMERLAGELRNRHQEWKDHLSQARPDSDRSQIASEALEMALAELENRLPTESPPNEEALSLDAAMAFICRPMPRA